MLDDRIDEDPDEGFRPSPLRRGSTYGALVAGGILILASFLVPQVISRTRRTAYPRTRADIHAITSALEYYAADHGGQYPATLEELVTPNEQRERYLLCREVPRDPWGRDYGYDPPTPDRPRPRIYSLGSDGAVGGEGQAADVSNLQLLGE